MGRSGMSWLKITFFYLIYYCFLGFLAYGSVGFWSGLVEDEATPYVRTRTDQPGMAAEPANSCRDKCKDANNLKYSFNPDKESTYAGENSYVSTTMKFLEAYPRHVKSKFTEEMIKSAYASNAAIYFLRLNKIHGWEPVPYASPEAIAVDHSDSEGNAYLTFEAGTFEKGGVYFYCAVAEDSKQKDATKIDVEFINMNGPGLKRPFHSSKYGYIPEKEFKDVQTEMKKRKKIDPLGSNPPPFVAVKVTSSGDRDQQQRFNCYSVAQNTQKDRQLGTGMVELGFVLSNE